MATPTQAKRQRIYERDNWQCHYCGVKVSTKVVEDSQFRATLEHIIPKHEGGTNSYINLVTCCYACNNRRQHTPMTQWLKSPWLIKRRTRLGNRVVC